MNSSVLAATNKENRFLETLHDEFTEAKRVQNACILCIKIVTAVILCQVLQIHQR